MRTFSMLSLSALTCGALLVGQAGNQQGAPTAPAGANGSPYRTQAGGSGSAGAGMSGSATVSAADRNFVKMAANGGMFEVESGKLAQEKGASDMVKQHGAQMVKDHTQANQELLQIAGQKGITPPTQLMGEERATVAKLQRLDGAAFDKAYLASQVKSHRKSLALLQKGAKDSDLNAWAQKTLPVVQQHQQETQQHQSHMKSGTMSSDNTTGSMGSRSGSGSGSGSTTTSPKN